MDWRRADPAREIEGQINRLREDARCQQVQIEDAVSCELAAEGAAEAARAIQVKCRRRRTEDADEIDRLLGELHDLLPKQQRPENR